MNNILICLYVLICRNLSVHFECDIDENGDIDVRYKVPDPNAAREYYYIPVKYPQLVDLEFIYSYSEYLNLTYEYMGHTPKTSVEVICDNYEYIDEKEWVCRRSIPSKSEALNKAYPQYFDSSGCYIMPEYFSSIYYKSREIEIEEGVNNITVEIPAIDAGFFGRYHVDGEYIQVKDDALIWRGHTFRKCNSKWSRQYTKSLQTYM